MATIISAILPIGAVAAEAIGDVPDDPVTSEEAAFIAGAVEKRQREFAIGRSLARRALSGLSFARVSIAAGAHREPTWPPGIVGSITHCLGYSAAVVARTETIAAIGIDAEVNAPISEGVLRLVAREEERAWIREQSDPTVCWDRLLFSAKESVFKAWFPLMGRWLGFEAVRVTFQPDCGAFRATLIGEHATVGRHVLNSFEGRYMIRTGHLLTAVAVPSVVCSEVQPL